MLDRGGGEGEGHGVGRGCTWSGCHEVSCTQNNTLLHAHILMIVLPPEVDPDNDTHHNDSG